MNDNKTVGWLPALAAALALLVTPELALAWGAKAHEAIAALAQERLDPRARQMVDELLAQEPGETLASISAWADRVRSPTTAAWHYVNFPRDAGCRYEASRDCPEGRCVVGALQRQFERLKLDRDPKERLIGLKWVVHLVGDVHQPLHAGFGDDRGANLFQLQAFGRGANLHSLWDGGIASNWPTGLEGLMAEARDGMAKVQVTQFDPKAWAEQSCRVVTSNGFYPAGRFVDENYLARWRPVLTQRIAEAASRLAALLNAIAR